MKYKLIFTLFITFSLFVIMSSDKTSEEDSSKYVMEITPKTFYDQLKKYGRLVLYFYSHKCSHCQDFNPLFDEAARLSHVAKHGFGFVKLDGPVHEEFADTFRMTETPSIYFVEKADGQLVRSKYGGRRSIRAINRYLTKKYKYRPRELTSYKTFRKLVEKAKSFLIFFGDKTKHSNVFSRFINSSLDKGIENIFWTKSDEFYEKYKVNKNNIEAILHSNRNSTLDEGLKFNLDTASKKLTPKYIHHLVNVYTRPSYASMNEEGLQGVPLGEVEMCIAIFNKKSSKYYDKLIEEVKRTSEKHRKDCFFFIAPYNSKEAKTFVRTLHIKKEDLPAYVIFAPDGTDAEESTKYFKKGSLKVEEGDYMKFFEGYKTGKIEKYLMSEPIPKNPVDHLGVYKVVGHTFKDVILNKAAGKHVIINVCAENRRCHNWELRYGRAVKKLKKNENLFFAKIDLRKNEFEHVNVGITPTIAFIYDGLNRFENIQLYDGNLTTKGLIEFIDKQIKLKNKKAVLKVDPLPDDKENEEREKYSPIKPQQESEDEEEPEEPEENKNVNDVWEGKEGEQESSEEHVDLDEKQEHPEEGIPEVSDHIKEGL